jgi:hypothetical protein
VRGACGRGIIDFLPAATADGQPASAVGVRVVLVLCHALILGSPGRKSAAIIESELNLRS